MVTLFLQNNCSKWFVLEQTLKKIKLEQNTVNPALGVFPEICSDKVVENIFLLVLFCWSCLTWGLNRALT